MLYFSIKVLLSLNPFEFPILIIDSSMIKQINVITKLLQILYIPWFARTYSINSMIIIHQRNDYDLWVIKIPRGLNLLNEI